jgi:hypothetical protein
MQIPPTFLRNGRNFDAQSLAGHFDVVVEAFDTHPIADSEALVEPAGDAGTG